MRRTAVLSNIDYSIFTCTPVFSSHPPIVSFLVGPYYFAMSLSRSPVGRLHQRTTESFITPAAHRYAGVCSRFPSHPGSDHRSRRTVTSRTRHPAFGFFTISGLGSPISVDSHPMRARVHLLQQHFFIYSRHCRFEEPDATGIRFIPSFRPLTSWCWLLRVDLQHPCKLCFLGD